MLRSKPCSGQATATGTRGQERKRHDDPIVAIFGPSQVLGAGTFQQILRKQKNCDKLASNDSGMTSADSEVGGDKDGTRRLFRLSGS
jgi:hypothetical protein